MSLPFQDPAWVFLTLFGIVLLAPLAAERARVPGIIGLILAGTLVGPGGFGIIERDGAVGVLGGVGLLYLMFLAALELDLDGFRERPRDSLVYGGLTTVIPMVLVTGTCLAMGFSLLGSLLIASALTSHTPISLPIIQRFGLGRNPAVTTTMGATLICVVAALLILAVVAAVPNGDAGRPLFWVGLTASLSAFLAFTAWGLPRLIRRFFSGLGQDRNVRFTFVLVVVFGLSATADLAGIEPVVGAFLAGLALNRFVPPGSVLGQRVQFLGSSLLIPLFLLSTGMLIDPAVVLADPRVAGVGLTLTAVAIIGKWLPTLPTAKLLGYDAAQRGVMFSLSVGQAAGAIAAIIVGREVGLLDDVAVNAGVLVMLGTCVVAPLVAARVAPRVVVPGRRTKRLGETVVVPVANPRSAASLVRLAALVAGPDSGAVVPVNILAFDAPLEVLDEHREITRQAEQVALAAGADARSQVRIDASPTAGVLHALVENDATCLLLGWKGYANAREHFFGSVIDTILSRAPVPVLVCRTGTDPAIERIVLSVAASDITPGGLRGFEIAAQAVRRIARQADVPLLLVSEVREDRLPPLFASLKKVEIVHDRRPPPEALVERAGAGDVIVVGAPPAQASLGHNAERLAHALPDRTIIAVVPRLEG